MDYVVYDQFKNGLRSHVKMGITNMGIKQLHEYCKLHAKRVVVHAGQFVGIFNETR